MIDIHVYSVPGEFHSEASCIAGEEAVLEAIHRHPEGPHALSLSSPQAILASMEAVGIEKSVLVSLPWRGEEACRRNNDHVLSAAEDSETLYAVCAIQCEASSWEHEADRVRRAGAIGFKINVGWQGGALDSPVVCELARYAHAHGMFLMTHVDHAFKPSVTGPPALFSLACKCPETRIVAAHLGGLLGLYRLHPPLVEKLRNVWFDTAVSSTLEMIRFHIQAGLVNRLVFGSDFPFNHSHSQSQVVAGIRALGLSEPDFSSIMRDNFLLLIGAGEETTLP